ncbi:MAG: Endonuclease/Exonuclease/phosphatase family protein [Syntrophus sp. PtaB.Bin001]|nr:MAG: Endonuclease/Exonuclease/phosphatase family protein [Syntrophus sp. PtaB.Bin001]
MNGLKFAKEIIDNKGWPIVRLFDFRPQLISPETKTNCFVDTVSGGGLEMNVMSFNIRRGTRRDGINHWIYRRKLVREIFSSYRPDVLGLQEALDFQMSEILNMLPGYEKVGIGNLGGSKGLHNAILYDAKRFLVSEEGTFWFSDTPEIPGSKGWGNIIPRICTWARLIEKKSHQAFYFYNIHLDHLSLRSRKKSVVSLTRCIHSRTYPDPFVLTGDFNAGERSAPIRYLKGNIPLKITLKDKVLNPVPLTDTFRVRYPAKRNIGTYHGYGRYFFRFKLDYIFVSSAVRVIDTEIIRLRWENCYPSDHFPLLAHVDLPVDIASAHPSSFFDQAINH